jgi:hypothetical protein
MPFEVAAYAVEDLPADLLDPIALLTAEAYERDLLADVRGTDPASAPAALRERLLRAFRQRPAGQTISVVCARGRHGERIVVATARITHSDRHLPVGDTVGDTGSPFPTHRFWGGFRYPTMPGLFAPSLPESAVGEFTQLAAADRAALEPYVARGVLLSAEADAAARGAVFAAIAAVYARDQALSAPPRGYVFDTRAKLAGVLTNRYGLHIVPLFGDGVELRPDMLADPLHARTYRRWLAALAPHVPPEVLDRGLRATVRHLADAGFTGWARLPMRLPWLLINDAQTAAGMRRLAGLLPSAMEEPLVAAD